MNANGSIVAFVATATLCLGLAGCRSTELRTIDIGAAIAAGPPAWEEARRLEAAGRFEEALRAYEISLEQAEDDIELHRAYQKLLMRGAGKAALFDVYRARLERSPNDPAAHYLYGRLFNDPEPKRAHFRRALELDPAFPWALHGLGTLALEDGDLATARTLLSAALQAEPRLADTWIAAITLEQASGDTQRALELASLFAAVHGSRPDGPLLMAELASQVGDHERAIEASIEALRRQPDSELAQRSVRRRLSTADPVTWRRALDASRPGLRPDPAPEVLTSLGHYHALLGHSWRAIRRFREAQAAGARPTDILPAVRRLSFELGDYQGGYAAWKRTVPPSLLRAPENRLRPVFENLERAAEAAMGQGEVALNARRELAAALETVGWLDEARHVWGQIAATTNDREAENALDRLERRVAFEDGLSRLFKDIYAGRRPDLAASLFAVIEELRSLSLATVGRDVVGDPPIQSYFLIGDILDPDGAGLMQYLREGNRFFLLGQESGGAVQATLMSIVSHRERVTLERGGTPLQFDEIVCESQAFGGVAEAAGAEYAGATFEGFYYVQLDSVRRTAHEMLRGARLPADLAPIEPRTAVGSEERRSTWEPLGVMARMALSMGWHDRPAEEAWSEALELVFDGVAVHEQGHLVDVAYFLPITSNLWRGLGLLTSEGFSAGGIRATLEGRAQRVALAESASPRLALAHALGYLPNRDAAPPHSDGFSRLLDAFLEEVDARRDELSALDPNANLLQQLDRLDDESIRRIARTLE